MLGKKKKSAPALGTSGTAKEGRDDELEKIKAEIEMEQKSKDTIGQYCLLVLNKNLSTNKLELN